ncbi:hypothetical protein LAJ60_01800 [Bartonella taylorii]|uniref:Lipoprotein n=1 Tax=Bartonella taylorii TaxID=33046 RepID=A0A9Q8YYU7_BARTA|nr:hypothetical protein [Bartonella taylorii]USP03202.1 hypothetical protein LAJ60_01800 [Bartonella taylorii]
MKLIEKVMLVCTLNFLAGCVANRSVSCGGWLPIYLDMQDVEVTRYYLARDILKRNKQRAHLCDWKDGQETKQQR